MVYKAIVSDWNGTLFKYPTTEPENKKIAYAVLDDAKQAIFRGKVWRVSDVFRLIRTKKELSKRLGEYKEGKRHLWEVYGPFNENVLRGKPVSFINGIIDEFAKESAGEVDERVLRPIQAAHSDGSATGILSVSYDYTIRRVLQEAGYPDAFDKIVANRLEVDGNKARGLTLGIYGKKAEVLEKEFFDSSRLNDRNTAYIGDSEDDEPVACVLSKGNFIVSFMASDVFKQKMAKWYKAFVPENEEDLHNYLQKNTWVA